MTQQRWNAFGLYPKRSNWPNILSAEDFQAKLAGGPHRALDIGKTARLATSFAFMPEAAPWGFASWNETTLNSAYAHGAKALKDLVQGQRATTEVL